MKQERVIFIDYARTLAILMVIMCHVIDVNCLFWLGYQEMSRLRQMVIYALLTFGRCGVPLFLMITGYLLLDRDYRKGKWKEFYRYKWLHLFLITEVWFGIYELFSVLAQKNSFNIKDFLCCMLFIKEPPLSHTWYLPMILQLYIILPILSNILHRMPKRGKMGVVLMVALLVLLFQILGIDSMTQRAVYLLYVMIGYSYKKLQESGQVSYEKKIRRCYGILSLSSLLGAEIYLLIQYKKGEAVHLWYDNPCVVVLGTMLFGILLMSVQHSNAFVKKVSSMSFGIYLIHNMIALSLIPWILEWHMNLYVSILVTYGIVFITSCVCVILIEKIPYIGNWILYRRKF